MKVWGARLFLTGRTTATADRVTNEITSVGGEADTAQVDALDEQAVAKHLADVVATAGSIDISFNAVGFQEIQGVPFRFQQSLPVLWGVGVTPSWPQGPTPSHPACLGCRSSELQRSSVAARSASWRSGGPRPPSEVVGT